MTAVVNNRGSVRVYAGSLTEFRGLPVIGLDDCECPGCFHRDPWDPARYAAVRLIPTAGPPGHRRMVHLEHVRWSSLVDPAELVAP